MDSKEQDHASEVSFLSSDVYVLKVSFGCTYVGRDCQSTWRRALDLLSNYTIKI